MDRQIERRSSAFYQRRHRERLRELGLLKKELWVLPEYADDLAAIEKRMRKPRGDAQRENDDFGGTTMSVAVSALPTAMATLRDDAHRDGADRDGTRMHPTPWHARALFEALLDAPSVRDGAIVVELIEGTEPGLYLTIHDYGDLPLFMAVVGQQIVVEALLWPVAHVRDTMRFNEEVLRTHKLFPLSTLGVETINGEAVYIMFGALSAHSSLTDIVFEIETLADNVIRATEAYEPHLRGLA
jgi:hypothetical protein